MQFDVVLVLVLPLFSCLNGKGSEILRWPKTLLVELVTLSLDPVSSLFLDDAITCKNIWSPFAVHGLPSWWGTDAPRRPCP
jgi:hypothetical protein